MEGLSQSIQEELLARQEQEVVKDKEVKILTGDELEHAREAFMNKFNERINAWTLSREDKKEVMLPGGEAFIEMVSNASADNFEGSLDYENKELNGEQFREIIYRTKVETQSIKEKMEEKASKEGRLKGPHE